MSMYDQFKTDPVAEKEGVWIDYGEFRVRVARAGGANKKFQKTIEAMARPYRRAIATDSLPKEKTEEILRAAHAAAVVTGWQVKGQDEDGKEVWVDGIEDPNGGEPLEVSPENILAAWKVIPELYADIKDQAGSWAMYRASLREEASGN